MNGPTWTADEQILNGTQSDHGHVVDESRRCSGRSKHVGRRIEPDRDSAGRIEFGVVAVAGPGQSNVQLTEVNLIEGKHRYRVRVDFGRIAHAGVAVEKRLRGTGVKRSVPAERELEWLAADLNDD